ncbi:DUF2306 domain-containing protein [Amycolatopsis nigrescens]|uniref:DUF2306 domain-containing protein n=1 Tax=Amycolatopsis nigrescens TaxID=381445 RepID=UPI00037BA0BB|nr:DUF2306 domain-containing protein [Amycolatopsis nigrescens]
MTQHLERPGAQVLPRAGPHSSKGGWGRRSLLGFAVVAAAFAGYQVLPYLSLDPGASRIPTQDALHYAFLAGHVITGTIAVLCTIAQLWPWLRRHHPRAHRVSGRIYLFAGALPCAVLALAMFPVSYGPGSVAVLMSAVLWSVTAVLGWKTARQRRYAEHRRWMLYSFAIMWGLAFWGFVIGYALKYLSPVEIDNATVVEAARWVGWVGNLLVVHWWLERRAGRTVVGVPRRTPATR